MEAYSPAFEGKREELVINRILRVSAEVGYRELSHHRLKQHIQSTRDRWVSRKEKRDKGHKGHKVYRVKGNRHQNVAAPLTMDRPGISTCPRPRPPWIEPAAVPAPVSSFGSMDSNGTLRNDLTRAPRSDSRACWREPYGKPDLLRECVRRATRSSQRLLRVCLARSPPTYPWHG